MRLSVNKIARHDKTGWMRNEHDVENDVNAECRRLEAEGQEVVGIQMIQELSGGLIAFISYRSPVATSTDPTHG